MLSFPPTIKAFVCSVPVDMHKSFDGLCGAVTELMGADPISGHLFVFFNHRKTLVKVLVWDRTGYCIWCKRLEQGRFHHTQEDVPIELPRLMLILEGIDLSTARYRKRFTIQKNS